MSAADLQNPNPTVYEPSQSYTRVSNGTEDDEDAVDEIDSLEVFGKDAKPPGCSEMGASPVPSRPPVSLGGVFANYCAGNKTLTPRLSNRILQKFCDTSMTLSTHSR